MSLKSAKGFLLDLSASDEVSAIISSLDLRENDITKKIDIIVAEAAKRGYDFTASELREIVDDYTSINEDDKLKNITGGNGKVNTIIDLILS